MCQTVVRLDAGRLEEARVSPLLVGHLGQAGDDLAEVGQPELADLSSVRVHGAHHRSRPNREASTVVPGRRLVV